MDAATHGLGEIYYPRLLLPSIQTALLDTRVVCVLGPRQCGKTTLVRRLDPNRPYIDLDDSEYYRVAREDPAGFVASLPGTATLDEVQRVPALLSAIKVAVDRDRRPGRFLLTGSANLVLARQAADSLAGRIETVLLQPLTEAEKERREGAFLSALLANGLRPSIRAGSASTIEGLPRRLVTGGFPEPARRSPSRARRWHRQYSESIIERDVRDMAEVRKAGQLKRFVEMLAVRTGTLVNTSNIASDVGLSRATVNHYLEVLERLFVIRRLPAWHSNESRRLVKSPKVHFVDTGLAAALARRSTSDWLARRTEMGRLLESFVVQQVIAQSAWTDPDLQFWHYRDKDKVEVDLVVTRGASTWGIEVKSSASVSSSDGRGLARLAARCGANFESGVILYAGSSLLPTGDPRVLAVPLSELWNR